LREHVPGYREYQQRVRRFIINKAKAAPKRIVFGEGEESKIIRAAALVEEEGIGKSILLGRPEVIQRKIADLGLHFTPEAIDPNKCDDCEPYAQAYHQLRQRKCVTLQMARQRIHEPNIFGLMMVRTGDADTFLSGLTYEYPDVIRPALEIFHTRPGFARVAGVYLVIVKGRVYVFTDATVNIDPSAEDLAEIA
jgi:malate dehydrogenase (oxaloacetate-decarboxylating)(NADP+)